jgi:hypothetical protein
VKPPVQREAERRIETACDLIRSAYRLHPLDPQETLSHVQTAIGWGAEEMASDLREEAGLAR